MYDLSVLAGISDSSEALKNSSSQSLDGYYLQQMNIDSWGLRSINTSKRLLVLIESSINSDTLSNTEQHLLNQMISSIDISTQDIDQKIVSSIPHLQDVLLAPSTLLQISVIVVMGTTISQWLLQDSILLENKKYTYQNIPLSLVQHPAYLLKNTSEKKQAYKELFELSKFLI
jgi:hypothetical protein